ncbi:MAG: ribonuclease R [Eubacterium sp.]|nr:ribonuclease R [Eubacterium sp.]
MSEEYKDDFIDNILEELFRMMKKSDYHPVDFSEICDLFEVKSDEDKQRLLDELNRLCDDVVIVKTKKNRYILPPKGVMTGIYSSTKKGFGFVSVEGFDEDFFIPAKECLNAFNGDKVMIEELTNSYKTKGPKREARIVRVLSRNTKEMLGIYKNNKGFGFVIPSNKKIGEDLYIPDGCAGDAVTGSLVIAEIKDYGDDKKSPEGYVREVIGHIDDPSTDILQVLYTYGIPVDFPEDVEEQLHLIPDRVSEEEKQGRRDMRYLDTVTIDGEDAKDLDDAITLEFSDGIYHLGVHIADVSNYVREGSPLDKEALKRGTSNYLVDSVIPMLPHKLSNGICSLNQGEDRLTLSCLMDIDSSGKVLSHEIVEGLINVNERMNYTDVAAILEKKENAPVERYKSLIPMFERMLELSEIIRKVRRDRGSIDFDISETKIIVDESGVPVDIHPYDRNSATKIIEDFMLIANETVAEQFYWSELPFEYRVHETPVSEKVEKLRAAIRNFGIYFNTGVNKIHPKEYQKLLDGIEGQPYEQLITKITLRSMQQARYGTECIGHFGLACKYYCHFTSPIRRYPDLQIHRIIKEFIHGTLNEKRVRHYQKILPGIAMDNSAKERRAVEAERDVVKLKQIEYMSQFIGHEFEGVVSGFTNQNIFVELPNTVEGAISVSRIDEDSYEYNEAKFEMAGLKSGKVIKLGDSIKVKLIGVSKEDRTIDFMIS